MFFEEIVDLRDAFERIVPEDTIGFCLLFELPQVEDFVGDIVVGFTVIGFLNELLL